ncbi:MAG: ABC transporter ATP-binding protein [Anaerolineae bacterium]|nr:ABC transporter ATP-binding protein [Anaerolineae bacterium]
MDAPVISVKNLAISYETSRGDVPAVRNVTFDIYRGQTLGLVGESGCGKSTVAYGLVNYLGRNGKISGGDIVFQGQSLVGRSGEELRKLRGNSIGMVYQDPFTSLNPAMNVGEQMMEVLTVHQKISTEAARDKCLKMLQRVYMPSPEKILERYPHQISGGQQQRVVIAMALLNNPSLLIMDEPTTALDVTIEAAVLDLIADLRRDFDTAILFISHNLGVVARVCERVGVMYAGELVELAMANEIFANPRHPYTQGLMRALPRLGVDKASSALYPIRGRVPSPSRLPPGCTFEPRCDYATEACRTNKQVFRALHTPITQDAATEPDVLGSHKVRCQFAEQIDPKAWVPAETLALYGRSDQFGKIPETVLDVDMLSTHYKSGGTSLLGAFGLGKRETVKAVDGVSFKLPRGKSLGVVGESGSGKSTLVKTIIGLEDMTSGKAQFMSFSLEKSARQRDLSLVKELQMVFQNPDATLNPAYSVGKQIERPLRRFGVVPSNQVRDEVIRLLREVKLDEHYYDRLPRQLSGGEKQRVGIARAFAGRPDLVLADEPVSALDVSVQAAVLNLLLGIQKDQGTTMIFIAHDLSVVRFFCDYIAVMYCGQIMEIGPAEAIYSPPYHPYTESLLAAVPIPDPTVQQSHIRLDGAIPSPANPPSGCRFHTRCPRRGLVPGDKCVTTVPTWQTIRTSDDDNDSHRIFCHIPAEELSKLEQALH